MSFHFLCTGMQVRAISHWYDIDMENAGSFDMLGICQTIVFCKLLHYEGFTTKNFEIRSIFKLRFFNVSQIRTSYYGLRLFEVTKIVVG